MAEPIKRIAFRFFFIYFLLTITPWFWFYQVPGISYLASLYGTVDQWIVEYFNGHFLHVKEKLNAEGNGSGDTSFAWAQFHTYLILSALGCLVWNLVDRKRLGYDKLEFVLKNVVRYNVVMVAFGYGIIKLFALQMPFPNLNQLATPLGDLLPMRLSWLFMGYSTSYQVFSGVMEIMVGIFLLNRKTVTLGSLMGVAVFLHVFLLNVSYDIPVKLFSFQIVICCLFLVSYDWKRIVYFFFLNKPVEPGTSFDFRITKPWQNIVRIIFKIGFCILIIVIPLIQNWKRFKEVSHQADVLPIKSGMYMVKTFIKNNDTIPYISDDVVRWKDVVFEKGGLGSINVSDTLFKQLYQRSYFSYNTDTTTQAIFFRKYRDKALLFDMQYTIANDSTILLQGRIRDDSIWMELNRMNRHFQLTEKQFHWISEANR